MKKMLCGFLLILTCTQTIASFKEAVAAYEAENYAEAMQEFQNLSELGNKGAQYNLGMMYLDALGTKQDLVKAYAWIKLSDEEAKAQDTQAILEQIKPHLTDEKFKTVELLYADLLRRYGKDVILNDLKPVFDITQKGNDELLAKPISAIPPKYPFGAQANAIEGFTRVEFNLDEQGKPKNLSVIASYPKGVFDVASTSAIRHWTFDVTDIAKNKGKLYRYKLEYKMAGGGSRSGSYFSKARKALKEIEKKAVEGDAVAQYYYAKYGPAFLVDSNINATEWYYKSANQGVADAQYEIGLNLINGQGCKVDKEKGLKWLTQAAHGNLGRSQLKLSKLYGKMSTEEAIEKRNFWLDKAFKASDKEVFLDLAAYMLETVNYQAKDVLSVLNQIDKKLVSDPITYHELYARSYANLGDFEKATKHQRKANKIVRRIGKLPKQMRLQLETYKSKAKS